MNFLAYVFIHVVDRGPNNFFFYMNDLFIPKFQMCAATETNIYPPNTPLSAFFLHKLKKSIACFVIYFDFFFLLQIKLELKLFLQKNNQGKCYFGDNCCLVQL